MHRAGPQAPGEKSGVGDRPRLLRAWGQWQGAVGPPVTGGARSRAISWFGWSDESVQRVRDMPVREHEVRPWCGLVTAPELGCADPVLRRDAADVAEPWRQGRGWSRRPHVVAGPYKGTRRSDGREVLHGCLGTRGGP